LTDKIETSEDSAAPLPAPEKKEKSVARSAAIMGVATFLSRIAGLAREQVFAYFFGAGIWTDSFNVALRIPNLLRDLFAEGAMSAAFVPTFNIVLKKDGREAAFRLTNLLATAIMIILGVIIVFGIIFTPYLVRLLAPEFEANPEQFEVTILMTRIMFPFLVAISLAAIAMGILNSIGEFFIPAIAPAFLSFSMIIGAFTLCPLAEYLGMQPIVGMAMGAMLGGIFQFLIQWIRLWREGYRFRPAIDMKHPGLQRVFKLIVPGTIGLGATQMNVAVSTILATSEGAGAVSWLLFGFKVMQLPMGIFGVAIAQATLPVFSRMAADDDRQGMAKTVSDSVKLTGFINIFCCMALLALANPIIRILFQHGRFTPEDTVATATALRAFAVGLFFTAVVKVLGPMFYALNRARIPVAASFVSMITNIILNLALVGPLGYWGLAVGSSVAAVLNSVILYFMISRRIKEIQNGSLAISTLKNLAASAVSALVMWYMFPACESFIADTSSFSAGGFINNSLALVFTGTSGTLILLSTAKVLGIEESGSFISLIARKLGVKTTKP
jgi:putative peptidoglycan lipid II flippase